MNASHYGLHNPKKPGRLASLAALVSAAMTAPALAATAGGGGGNLPWATPLQTFLSAIQGPVAYAISIMGVIVCGAILVFAGEIGEFVRRFIFLIFAIALMLGASQIVGLFTGAII